MSIPKGARRLVIGDDTWHWKVTSYRVEWYDREHLVNIWGPDGKRKEVWFSGPVRPGGLRRYIEENFLEKEIVVEADPTAVPGKLYVFRGKNMSESPDVVLKSPHSGCLPARYKYAKFRVAYEEKQPILLLSYKMVQSKKASYAKILVGEMVVDLKIEYPRTFRGYFARYEEWEKSQEAEDLRKERLEE